MSIKRYKLFDSAIQLQESLDENGRLMIKIGERKLCLVKSAEKYHVFDHLCPHNKHSLFNALINFQDEVVCPLHSYRYSLHIGAECEQKTGPLGVHALGFEDAQVFLYLKD